MARWLVTVPALATPGHLTMNGSRTPPSHAVALAPRKPPGWCHRCPRNRLDLTAIVGAWSGGLENVFMAAGFSGHGIMHAPAAGRALAELILDGRYGTLDLTRFGYARVLENTPYREIGIV